MKTGDFTLYENSRYHSYEGGNPKSILKIYHLECNGKYEM